MPILDLLHTHTFDSEMDRLRIRCFPEEGWGTSSQDAYDENSIHIACRADRSLAGYGRLTPGKYGYFRVKFGPCPALPCAVESIDFGRIVVAPAYRGHLAFELILLEGLLLASKLGFRYVIGSGRPERKFHPLIGELGFEKVGDPVSVTNNAQACLLQPVVAQTQGRSAVWYTRKLGVFAEFRAKGYEIGEGGWSPSVTGARE
jgi:hypothetical protein